MSLSLAAHTVAGARRAPVPTPPGVARSTLRTASRAMRRWSTAAARRCLACVLVLLCCAAHAAPDLAGHVAIAVDAPALAAAANVSDSVVTVTNTSAVPIAAPFTLTIAPIQTPGVAVAYPTSLDHAGVASIAVALPLGVLEPGAQVAVPVRFVNAQRRQFTFGARATGTVLAPETTVPLEVAVHLYSGDSANPRGVPAGAGVAIVVDGAVRALTDAGGKATVLVPASVQAVSARLAPTGTGMALVALTPGLAHSADIVLADDGQVYADATLRFDAVMQSLLPGGLRTMTGRFVAPDGGTVRLAHLGSAELRYLSMDRVGSRLTSSFTLNADGTINCRDTGDLQEPATEGNAVLVVTGTDAQGNTYRGAVNLMRVAVAPKVTLVRPAADPGMDLEGIAVTATVTRLGKTFAVFTAFADAAGNFTLPAMPDSGVKLSAHVVRDGRHYTASRVIDPQALTGAAQLPLLGAADLWQAEPDPEIPAGRVSVTQEMQGHDVKSSTLTVPRGTRNVTLSYLASASPYSLGAVKDIRVVAGPAGVPLYSSIERFAHHKQDYINSTYLTSLVDRQLDVAALAADGPLELTLYARLSGAPSPGQQRIEAALAPAVPLVIESAAISDDLHITHDRRHVSMPEPGESNLFQRRARLRVRKADGFEITNVKVELSANFIPDLIVPEWRATVLDAPPGPDVVVDGETIDTVLTFTAAHAENLRQIDYDSSLHYQITVTARAPDGTEATAFILEGGKRPLWRAPANLPRYGVREPGGDDWVSSRMYEWLQENADAVTAINDFSGEHGTDLGHPSHGGGNEFDMYHFYTFPGADPQSGVSNYRLLVARIRDLALLHSLDPDRVASGKAAAAQVQAWIRATRQGIDRLAAAGGVTQVHYILGGPDSAGIGGMDWGYRLLTTGRVTVGGVVHDLGTRTWENYIYHPVNNHHHHVHVALVPDYNRY